ncbi:hypothetical protein [Gandjariella thermophila]|uniref:hypothetical protein n=1 Tax=Gandjariella thermophila TaxID=1931992 RepID=UPI0010F999A6|nr:hypothetical protein [Gandjariella thermophila]
MRRRPDAAGWLVGALWLNLLWVTDVFVLGGRLAGPSRPGAPLTALGRLAGLYGALLLVGQLVLISRLPWIGVRGGRAPEGAPLARAGRHSAAGRGPVQ